MMRKCAFFLFLLSADFFFNIDFFTNTIIVKGFGFRSGSPDLGPNCLQRLSADKISSANINYIIETCFMLNSTEHEISTAHKN